jgi:hypothetical protein
MLSARMRTLLNESLPPHLDSALEFSLPLAIQSPRNFSPGAVSITSEPDLTEVGADGTVIATSGASAGPASSASEGGLTTSGVGAKPFKQSPAL